MAKAPGPLTDWRRAFEREAGRPVEEAAWETPEGISIAPLYTGVADGEPGFPGAYPFTRGARASMYVGQPWTLRQYAGFSTAGESNRFYRAALARGQRGLSVAFDLATHRGYDSDSPRVVGDVGKAGVAIDSVEDMKALFEGIPLGDVSVSMTMSGAVLPVLAAFIVAAEEQGVPEDALRGTIQNDILKEFMVRNTFIYPPEPSLRIVADVIEHASRHMPRYNTVSISGYHMHEAGAPADLELAFTLADGLEYVAVARERGLDVDAFAPRLSFFFAVGMNLFVEVAKLRAARTLWAEAMRERFHPAREESLRLRMHCQTSGVSLTGQDPYNNVVRTALEALAAVLGGTQSLHTNAFDEALALPGDDAARLALNTQLILQHEAGLTRVIDPLGGSHYVEALTRALVERARGHLREIDGRGGMARAIEQGYPQRAIERAAVERQARLDQGIDVIVGVNRYRTAAPPIELRHVDASATATAQRERLRELRERRDGAAVQASLDVLREAARAPDRNLLPPAIEAMRRRATVGEVSSALESVFGRYEMASTGIRGVYGRQFEQDAGWAELVARVEALARVLGRRPRFMVAKIGQDGHDRGAKVIVSAFADLGFDVDLAPLFQTADEVVTQAVDNDVHVIGVSSQAGAHDVTMPALLSGLRRAGAGDMLVVCGGIIPEPDAKRLRDLGVDAVFLPGDSVTNVARRVVELLEARLAPRGASS